MSAIDDFSKESGIAYLSLEVREKNQAARSLYSSCGWREAGIRRNFYSKPLDNAVIMIKELTKGN
jgi:ribosomal-protein-alanine N-acetyltransferase